MNLIDHYLRRLSEGTGVGNSWRRVQDASRPEQGQLDARAAFQGITDPVGGLPNPTPDGPPYAVKGGSLHVVKHSAHAHERMEERTPFQRKYVDDLQKAVDLLQLKKEPHYLPLRDAMGSVRGYAQFKGVPDRKYPVLATVLGPGMKPSGNNVEAMFKKGSRPETNAPASSSGQFDTDHIDPRPPESSAWNRKHYHLFSQEPARYMLQKAFDGVTTKPLHEVIESETVPTNGALP